MRSVKNMYVHGCIKTCAHLFALYRFTDTSKCINIYSIICIHLLMIYKNTNINIYIYHPHTHHTLLKIYSTTIQHLSSQLCILTKVKPQQRLGCTSVDSEMSADEFSFALHATNLKCIPGGPGFPPSTLFGVKLFRGVKNRCLENEIRDLKSHQFPVKNGRFLFIKWVGEPSFETPHSYFQSLAKQLEDFGCAPASWKKSEDLGIDPNVCTPNQPFVHELRGHFAWIPFIPNEA